HPGFTRLLMDASLRWHDKASLPCHASEGWHPGFTRLLMNASLRWHDKASLPCHASEGWHLGFTRLLLDASLRWHDKVSGGLRPGGLIHPTALRHCDSPSLKAALAAKGANVSARINIAPNRARIPAVGMPRPALITAPAPNTKIGTHSGK